MTPAALAELLKRVASELGLTVNLEFDANYPGYDTDPRPGRQTCWSARFKRTPDQPEARDAVCDFFFGQTGKLEDVSFPDAESHEVSGDVVSALHEAGYDFGVWE